MNAKLAIPFIWATTAALVVRLLTAWDQLPARVAVHFGMDMQPNGWSSKNVLAATVLMAVLGQAGLATLLLVRANSASGWIALVLATVNIALVSAFWQTIRYNVNGAPFQPLWMFLSLIAVFASITALMAKLMLNYYRR